MQNNEQAHAAGNRADEIIKNLANPAPNIVTKKAEVEVLDQVTQVPTPAVPTVDNGNWEARFKGMKASSDKTIHNLRQKVSQFDLMETENESLKNTLQETQAKIPTTPSEMLELFSQEELDGFNKMLDGRVGDLQSKVTLLEDELGKVHKTEQESVNRQAHQAVVEAVKAAVPDYTSIDNDPAFADWLNAPDNYGNIRYDLLVQAKTSSPPDVGRIVQLYVDFAGTRQVVQEVPKQYTQQELLQNPMTMAGLGGVDTPQPSTRVWDQAMISQLYKDKATGKITKELFDELEQELFATRR